MDDAFALTPPEPVAAVTPETADAKMKLPPAAIVRLDAQVAEFVEVFVAEEPHSERFRTHAEKIASLGKAEIEKSANISNAMLQRPVAAKGALDAKAGVAHNLTELRNVIEKLDPAVQGNMFEPRRILGVLPFGSKVRSYFDKYQSAQSQIDAIMQTLYRGKDDLLRDNVSIENEKQAMWTTMETLRAAVYLCDNLDHALEEKLGVLAAADPERAKSLREEVLLAARQRKVDLLTQLAVNVQGYQVLDLLKKNNIELMKGVDRATTTTMSALRTAVTASQALAGQRLVLNQITALNQTTGSMIESTSQLLGTQGAAIHEQASSATIDLERLKAAFTNIYAAMDAVDTYKAKALTNLASTADALQTELRKADVRLKGDSAKNIPLPSSPQGP